MTQDNRGKHTAGVDGIKSLKPAQRLAVAENLEALPTGKPARRIWIPKPGKNEQRPLSIPTLYDRARQALVKQALEAEWEAKFEPNSYGFRPGRSAPDAIGAIFIAINKQPKYVLDADIAKCFDRIDRKALLRKTGTFPSLQRLIRRWLEAGVMDQEVFSETDRGTQQGSVLSPVLANIALHGLETHLRRHFPWQRADEQAGAPSTLNWKPQVIGYADDLVVLHRDKAAIEQCDRFSQSVHHSANRLALRHTYPNSPKREARGGGSRAGPRLVQLRYQTDLTSTEYVNREAWQEASLERCPLHPQGGCGFARHGSYERVDPPGTRIPRWYCRLGHQTFSLLPDCFAARWSGTLTEIEVAVEAVEQAPSLEAAATTQRLGIELPGALRWLRRRLHAVQRTLVVLKGLLPAYFANAPPTLAGFRQALGVERVLVVLRELGADYLATLPPPLGFCPPRGRGGEPHSAVQHRAGPDPPPRIG